MAHIMNAEDLKSALVKASELYYVFSQSKSQGLCQTERAEFTPICTILARL